jgi:hypothetical protein
MLTPRELATVLAALRHWRETQGNCTATSLVRTWPHFGEHDPLSPTEVDALCQRLNEPCGCEIPGPFHCGIPGVLARVAEGRLKPKSVERCDECGRFPSDDAARRHLVELGYLSACR